MIETLGAPAATRGVAARRAASRGGGRRAAPAAAGPGHGVRAFEPFDAESEAERWLEEALASEDSIDALLDEGIDLLNRALHAHAVASGDPLRADADPRRAAAARLGYGSGEEVGQRRLQRGSRGRRPRPAARRAASSAPKSCARRSGLPRSSAGASGSTLARR